MGKPRPEAHQTQLQVSQLIGKTATKGKKTRLFAPLAERMRPRSLKDIIGQDEALNSHGFIQRSIASCKKDPRLPLPSLLIQGPPGCGKTTIARLYAKSLPHYETKLFAPGDGLSEFKKAVDQAQTLRASGRRVLLVVDEIHRFTKTQQDYFLAHVEAGTVSLVGLTTEPVLIRVNPALRSRCHFIELKPLRERDLLEIAVKALNDSAHGVQDAEQLDIEKEAMAALCINACGDSRRLLSTLESAVISAVDGKVTTRTIQEALGAHDRVGDRHYALSSALIKSIRGSDVNAALLYLAQLLRGQEDVAFIARRLVISACEDVGIADPRAITLAESCAQAALRVGVPECCYPLGLATAYLAKAPKSSSVTTALEAANELIERLGPGSPQLLPPPAFLPVSAAGSTQRQEYVHPAAFGNHMEQDCMPPGLRGVELYSELHVPRPPAMS